MTKQLVKDVMTTSPLEIQRSATLHEAAMAMKGADIGDVLVLDGESLCGIVTDRDIVVRGIAENKDPNTTTVGDVCSGDLFTVRPDDEIAKAVEAARDRAIRRFPVVDEGDSPVGMVSLGDLARELDPDSALADISGAPANS